MPAHRSRGDGGIHWDERDQRWIATASLGYDASGKRIIRRRSGRTKTEAKAKLQDILRDHADGLAVAPGDYTVADAMTEWLQYGLGGPSEKTKSTEEWLSNTHIVPLIGSRRLKDHTAVEVDRWLAGRARVLSKSSLRKVHSALNRAVTHAMVRDKVKRNVVALCRIPDGRRGRPSKALTLAQATSVLVAAEDHPMYAYVVMALLTGARTEELRALTWDHVDLIGDPDANPPIPPHIAVWRSVRAGGDTKTQKSRRTIALPARCIDALSEHRRQQVRNRDAKAWKPTARDLVFCTASGGALDSGNVRRAFRAAIRAAPGIDPQDWTPREMRHSFVSLLSDSGVPLEEISRLVGHKSTAVTELVYRKQIRPVIQSGAVAMNGIFGPTRTPSHGVGHGARKQGTRAGPGRSP